MSLLEKLWDDTLAGPRPESGLGKLRKQPTFTLRSGSGKESDGARMEEAVRVTRSIMIVKPPQLSNTDGTPPVSPAASPAGSTPPPSPFAGGRDSYRLRRKSLSDAYEKANRVGPMRPRPHDV